MIEFELFFNTLRAYLVIRELMKWDFAGTNSVECNLWVPVKESEFVGKKIESDSIIYFPLFCM
jgi:hypothetical protein